MDIKKTAGGLEVNTSKELTVADAIRLRKEGYQFKDLRSTGRGKKVYYFKKNLEKNRKKV